MTSRRHSLEDALARCRAELAAAGDTDGDTGEGAELFEHAMDNLLAALRAEGFHDEGGSPDVPSPPDDDASREIW